MVKINWSIQHIDWLQKAGNMFCNFLYPGLLKSFRELKTILHPF